MRLNESDLKAIAAVIFQLIPEGDRPLAELAMLDLVKFGAGFAMEAATDCVESAMEFVEKGYVNVDSAAAAYQSFILVSETRECLRRLSERVAYRSLEEVAARG